MGLITTAKPYLIAFFGILFFDAVYVIYIQAIARHQIHRAAITGSAITMVGAAVVVEYANNPMVILAAGAGGWAGTYLGNYVQWWIDNRS